MVTTIAPFESTEFENSSDLSGNMTVGGITTSYRVWNSLEVDIITAMATIGIVGVLSNVAVLAVLFKKENRKLATNRYLTSLAISEYAYS